MVAEIGRGFHGAHPIKLLVGFLKLCLHFQKRESNRMARYFSYTVRNVSCMLLGQIFSPFNEHCYHLSLACQNAAASDFHEGPLNRSEDATWMLCKRRG